MKAGVLGVPQHLLDQFGAVSPEVARAMADGARRLLGCDIALSATGVAGPGKDEWDHEVGTAFVAISTAEGAHVRALNLGSRPVRARLRTQTAHHAFDLALSLIHISSWMAVKGTTWTVSRPVQGVSRRASSSTFSLASREV